MNPNFFYSSSSCSPTYTPHFSRKTSFKAFATRVSMACLCSSSSGAHPLSSARTALSGGPNGHAAKFGAGDSAGCTVRSQQCVCPSSLPHLFKNLIRRLPVSYTTRVNSSRSHLYSPLSSPSLSHRNPPQKPPSYFHVLRLSVAN